MPDFIEGEFPQIKFSSKDEIASYVRSTMAERLKNTKVLPAAQEEIEQLIANTIDELQHYAFETDRDGALLASTFESSISRTMKVSEQAIAAAAEQAEISAGRAARAANNAPRSNGANGDRPPRRALLAGLAALGGVGLVHGAIAAATAVDKDSNARDWGRTALHSAEAIIGAGITWVAIAAMRGKGSIAR